MASRSISLKTRKMLWGRAASRCAFPNCQMELVVDATQTDDECLVGQECHIIAGSTNGPRGESDLTTEQRDKYRNLILLCPVHHKIIDDQPGEYTVECLQKMKRAHEEWVNTCLSGFDAARQRDEEQYADIIQEFCDRVDIDNWTAWSSWVLGGGGYPRINTDMHTTLEEACYWLLSRVWPNRYPEIESSFENFRMVLQDFLNVFSQHSEPHGSDFLATKKFYQIQEYDQAKYNRLRCQYEFHTCLVEDLMLELTRAANYICDQVRNRYFPAFRLREGVLLVTHGPYMDLAYRTSRCEYIGDERTELPYPGLEVFKTIREQRDLCFGRGTKPKQVN